MYNVSAILNESRYDQMAQTNLTIRIDEDIKRDAETLFSTLGMSMSGAINIFFRQAVRDQAIPFSIHVKTAEEKYNDYFTPEIIKNIKRSVAQAEHGDVITFTMAELEAMEDGEIPQRAIDFLASRKDVEGASG
jgi:DNA-damage-inducible protein J